MKQDTEFEHMTLAEIRYTMTGHFPSFETWIAETAREATISDYFCEEYAACKHVDEIGHAMTKRLDDEYETAKEEWRLSC